MLSAYLTGETPTPPQLLLPKMSVRPPVPFPDELHLLGALGEVDREPPAELPRPPRREPRRLGVDRVRGVDADLGIHPLGQTFAQPPHLLDYELDRLLGRADIVREELGVDGPGHP